MELDSNNLQMDDGVYTLIVYQSASVEMFGLFCITLLFFAMVCSTMYHLGDCVKLMPQVWISMVTLVRPSSTGSCQIVHYSTVF
jgi:hypothetical protein